MSTKVKSDSLEFDFLLLNTDAADGLAVVENTASSSVFPSLLPGEPPPLTTTDLKECVVERFLQLDDNDCHHQFLKNTQSVWPRQSNINDLSHTEPSSLTSRIQVDRNPVSGELLGFFEEDIESGVCLTASNSCSLKRAPGPPSDALRGTSTNFPFWPGGMNEPSVEDLMSDVATDVNFESDLLTCPPTFPTGYNFNQSEGDAGSNVTFDIDDIFTGLDNLSLSKPDSSQSNQEENKASSATAIHQNEIVIKTDNAVEKLISDGSSRSNNYTEAVLTLPANSVSSLIHDQWAVKIDISTSVDDFHKRIPDMAHKYPFELDTFQKQAVLHLEQHQSVFVAAHTSAGKTVVAEYAVALAAKHMTRVVYTSPIKALSNQKFRDFKQTFTDVGLITGDVQINPDAFCLIMTTEILRSMLYNGSDVIRDLEWVIFDEVHYINDAERGVVWEEVLIMLPEHCNVILLSATVPNTMEFANWVGRTKQKKMYVISTLKRPVPLEHYLYTGNSNKTSNEMFLLLDANRKFLIGAHKKAIDAKNDRASKHSKTFGARGQRGGNPASDKGVWLSLVARLKKLDQLPVVAFTLSRRRCDDNANSLMSLDLTSAAEKSAIHVFFNKCVQKLKGTDQKLPQVLQMATLLNRGIGVHHSGILPILKEVVEMLFARGFVKLLFATETFAMGVNMPARTVVFDSIRKHDGQQMRNLLPGEYIQMAGRAGRRGLDATGNVILLCKGDVPDQSDLHTMMLGRPTKLQSQFRLTYGMILNLLRVEQLRVEEVMKRSFSEFNARKDSKAQEERLKALKEDIDSRTDVAYLLEHSDYRQYMESCLDLVSLRKSVQQQTLASQFASKIVQTGRVVVIDNDAYPCHAAVVLKTNSGRTQMTFSCLIIHDIVAPEEQEDVNKWHPDYLMGKKLYRPTSGIEHSVIDVKPEDISYVTPDTLKINGDNIIADCKRREIPRFRSDPPDKNTTLAAQQLLRIVESTEEGLHRLDYIDDFRVNNVEIVEEIIRIRSLEESISTAFICVTFPMFHKQISEVEAYLKIEREFDNLKYLLSEQSLHLLPEYQQRVDVLKQLRYVDEGGAVQLKGRVACEISTHEILLTELVFENVFSTLEPTEIVALLSSFVFQAKVDVEQEKFPQPLKQGMQRILEVATSIGEVQRDCGLRLPVDEYVSLLKFGLVEVVYEWAKGTSFKDITDLTDVQEGSIVRAIQRLNETCRDVRNAARVIGDPSLYAKMEKCSELIKRDIVFAASLYTQ